MNLHNFIIKILYGFRRIYVFLSLQFFENKFRVTTKNKYTEILKMAKPGKIFVQFSCSFFLTKKCGRGIAFFFFAQIFVLDYIY